MEFHCYKCSAGPMGKVDMKRHFASDHIEMHHECNICFNAFQTSEILNQHRLTGHGIPLPPPPPTYDCCNCKKVSMKEEAIRSHYLSRHPKLTIECNECKNKFTDAVKRDLHICARRGN